MVMEVHDARVRARALLLRRRAAQDVAIGEGTLDVWALRHDKRGFVRDASSLGIDQLIVSEENWGGELVVR